MNVFVHMHEDYPAEDYFKNSPANHLSSTRTKTTPIQGRPLLGYSDDAFEVDDDELKRAGTAPPLTT